MPGERGRIAAAREFAFFFAFVCVCVCVARCKGVSEQSDLTPCIIYIILNIQNISRNSLVKADNGQEFFLVEVIAMMLKYMKDRLLNHDIRDRPDLPKVPDANNFTWVITVPAIWEAEGKQMMREAAYLVSQRSKVLASCIGQ